eukprot:TRINITY_DN13737_c0_g2_i1.p1 TRINITY_DN13737_c0_g2~~TRINITY_DN13737_c0_g2_i1.p1  ORF type:complete len:247 (-),score=64.44 TRINITY_DN13737_c0_g2_i1:135-875(-)
MGNQGACCSSGTGAEARCCGSSGSAAGDGAAPLDPLSDEVKGVDVAPAPGLADKELTVNAQSSAGSLIPAPAEADKKIEAVTEVAEKSASPDEEEKQFITYEDGSTYTGLIRDGKRNGPGIWQSKSCLYEGQWKADNQDGQGRQTWSDGRIYEGEFQNGRFSGAGKMVWHTAKGLLVYEGQYKEDLKHGTGKFVWPDGRTYDGEWNQGKRHGRGAYITAKTEKKVGVWENDKFSYWLTQDTAGVAP